MRNLFLGAFFSDEIVIENGERSGGRAILQYLSMLGIITLIFSLFSIVGFHVQRNKCDTAASDFQDILETKGVELSVLDDKLLINGQKDSDIIVNTFIENDEKNEIKVIIDNRDTATTFDDFHAICRKQEEDAGTDAEDISYEEYLALPEEQQKEYIFGIEYTGQTLEFTDERIEGYDTYLQAVCEATHPNYNAEIEDKYNELQAKRSQITDEEYEIQLYQLYFESYYPAITDVEQYGLAPTIRTYYDTLYKRKNENGSPVFPQYVILTQKYAYISINNDSGNNFTFSGNYRRLQGEFENESVLKELFVAVYYSQVNAVFLLFFMNAVRMSVLMVAAFMALALVWLMLSRYNKREIGEYFSDNLKMIFSNLTVATMITCPFHFICSLFLSRTDAFWYSILLISLLVIIRMVIFMIKNNETSEERNDA